MVDPLSAQRDRAIGTFLGLAVGDALGQPVEFMYRDTYTVTDMMDGGQWNLRAGDWTDDTSMAICLAESLLADPQLNERDLMERFVRWRDLGENRVHPTFFDIGNDTDRAISAFLSDPQRHPVAPASDNPKSGAGNGCIMRLAPVLTRWYHQPNTATDIAIRQSRTTHFSDQATQSAALMTEVCVEAIQSGDRNRTFAKRTSTNPSVAKIARGDWKRKSRASIESSGYVIHSLEAALWCVFHHDSFEAAVLAAVNLGHDTDTVGAITGQIAGALWGASGIPEKWRMQLAQRERLEALAVALADNVSVSDC